MIELRPLTRDNLDEIFSWVQDASAEFLVQWSGSILQYPLDIGQLEYWLNEAQKETPSIYMFAAVDDASGELIGHIALGRIDYVNRLAGLQMVLTKPGSARRGVGGQMVRYVLDFGFDQVGLNRIELYVFDFNEAAIGLYEKLGFVREGLFREILKFGDGYLNSYVYSMLRADWQKQRDADT